MGNKQIYQLNLEPKLNRGDQLIVDTIDLSGSFVTKKIDADEFLYSNPKEMLSTIGGLPKGSTFDGESMGDMWYELLYGIIPIYLYYGEDTDPGPLSESEIETLREKIPTDTFVRVYTFSGGGYKYLAYPITFGDASLFLDVDTDFEVPFESSYIVPVTGPLGDTLDYRIHRSTNIMGSEMNIAII